MNKLETTNEVHNTRIPTPENWHELPSPIKDVLNPPCITLSNSKFQIPNAQWWTHKQEIRIKKKKKENLVHVFISKKTYLCFAKSFFRFLKRVSLFLLINWRNSHFNPKSAMIVKTGRRLKLGWSHPFGLQPNSSNYTRHFSTKSADPLLLLLLLLFSFPLSAASLWDKTFLILFFICILSWLGIKKRKIQDLRIWR